jgi:two-component system, chemotaxis family, protein-glutamate methylesterase/glutaminase
VVSTQTVNKLVVVGASAGGVRALSALARGLPEDFAAPVLVVLHIGAHTSLLAEILANAGPLPARQARDGEPIEAGRIYVGAPDHHLMVLDDSLHLSRSAKEHHARPAIDPLFRSAALAYGAAVIGVLLTGRMDDGTAGLQAIKACGGLAVVQDPAEAEEPDMPASALRHVDVDHTLTLEQIPRLLSAAVAAPRRAPSPPTPERLVHEQAVLLAKGDPMEHLTRFAKPSSFACPDCHGALYEVRDAHPRRFRCHTGHGFTIRTLQNTLAEASEEALWSARRALQERLLLLREIAADADNVIPVPRLEESQSRLDSQLAALEALMPRSPDPVE